MQTKVFKSSQSKRHCETITLPGAKRGKIKVATNGKENDWLILYLMSFLENKILSSPEDNCFMFGAGANH